MLTICSPQLGISPETSSGGEVYDREILVHLVKLGAKILILLPKGRNYPKITKNFEITFASIKLIFPPYIFNFLVLPYLFKIYKKAMFQILRVHSPYFVGPAAVIFKFFHPEVKLVAQYYHLENNNLIFDLINRVIIKKFDLIITISAATKKEIIKKYRVTSAKILVTYPGLDNKFKPEEKDKKLLQKLNLKNKSVLLFLAGLKFRKNPQFLLDVLKKIKDQNIILLIAGSGQAEFFLKFKAKILGLSKQIRFLGFVPEIDKVKFYNLADLFLLPSKKEGFGMIVSEAAACAVPAIVANTSSLPEVVINGETGFVLPLKPELWTEKISLLIKDKKLREKLGQNARNFALKDFSWEETAKKQLAAFERLLR